MSKQFFCRKCGKVVFLPEKRSWVEKLFGLKPLMEENYCSRCGEPTITAITYECENGHPMGKWEKYCSQCGKLRKDEVPF